MLLNEPKLLAVAESEVDWPVFMHQLRRFIERRVDRNSVDDLVGRVLLKLVENQASFTAADSPRAWMYRVATNVITDHFRQLSSEHKKLTEAAHEPRTEESVVFAHERDEIELTQCVRPFISCLPEAYEQALSLTEIDGLTQAQAAEKLGISLSGLKSRVQRGREKLKKEFVNCCRIELDRRGRVIDVESKTPVCGC